MHWNDLSKIKILSRKGFAALSKPVDVLFKARLASSRTTLPPLADMTTKADR